MARYDFHCDVCKHSTIIFAHESHEVDPSYVTCQNCGKDFITLQGFSANDMIDVFEEEEFEHDEEERCLRVMN